MTLIVFAITRLVPGGPLERAIMEAQVAGADAMSFSSSAGQNMAISDAQLEQLKAYYGFDKPILESYVIWVGKILTGDLGTSYRYNEPVWNVIKDRFPISIYYGLVTLILTYAVCIPLGLVKAVRHRTAVDTASSIFIYWVCRARLCAWLAAAALFLSPPGLVPHGRLCKFNYDMLTPAEQWLDVIHHSILPLICYIIGSFALVTMLLKNHLLDNLAADYIRTAIAKRCPLSKRYCATRSATR